VQFFRIRFLSCTRIRGAKPSPYANTLRRWTSVIRGRAIFMRSIYGVHMMMVISCQGVATGWAMATGNVPERWVAELLLRTRAGHPRVQGPLHPETGQPQVPPPTDWLSLASSCGTASHKPIMTDSGFRGADWLAHWADAYGAQVCPKPQRASRAQRRRWSSARQVVETTLPT
jgi:hypothetical protein